MMQRNLRLIARLDIKGPNLIKGVHLEGLRVVGDPREFARRYYQQGADEILYVDSVASLYGRNNLTEIVRRAVEEVFVPITVAGGLKSLADVDRVLRAGADKVAINTAAIRQPELISEVASRYGSQCMVLSVEAIKQSDGRWQAFTDNGRERTGLDVIEWVQRAAELGAGEILLTSVDREGTMKGFDWQLTKQVAESVSIPVIASGGCGSTQDVIDVAKRGEADAIAIARALHYDHLTIAQLREAAIQHDLPVREYDEAVSCHY